MPQELRVVRCFQCLKFQVDIVKKANKWMCKVCGVKQSLLKEFFRGAGKECRAVVQELTARNIAMDEQEANVAELVLQNNIQLPKPVNMPMVEAFSPEPNTLNGDNATDCAPSKWASFLSEKDEKDLSDCLDLEKALAQVSSTSFDRERVNVLTRKPDESRTSKWTNFRHVKDDSSFADDCVGSTWQSSSVPRTEELSNPRIYNAKRKVCNNVLLEGNTMHSSNGYDQKATSNYAVNHSHTLVDFHRKKPDSRAQQRDTTVPSTSWDSRNEIRNAVCKKRKQSDSTVTPLMNFGKRISNVNTRSVVSESESDSVFASVPKGQKLEKAESESSSKWAKFVVQDEETNENNEDGFAFF